MKVAKTGLNNNNV